MATSGRVNWEKFRKTLCLKLCPQFRSAKTRVLQVCGRKVQSTPQRTSGLRPGRGSARRPPPLAPQPPPGGSGPGRPRRGGQGPARPPAPAALRAPEPEDPATPPAPRAFPRKTSQGASNARRVPGPLHGDGATGPPGAPLGPEGPRRPLPPAPHERRHGARRQARSGPSPRARLCPRPPGPAVGRRALTRCSAPSGGRGSRSRPSWGRSCWAWLAPPAAVSAAPRALGPSRGDPAAGRGARWGWRRNAEGRARRRDPGHARGAGQLRGTWWRAGRDGGTAGGNARGARTESRRQARGWRGGRGGTEHGRSEAQRAANRRDGRSRGGGGGTCGQ